MSFSDNESEFESDETPVDEPNPPPCPGMSPLSLPPTPLNGVGGTEGQGTNVLPDCWVSYRITTDRRDDVFDCFRNVCCVIAEEFSKTGIQHYHVVVAGHSTFEVVKKRLQRMKLGRAMVWSAKNNGTFLGAVSYTVKCDEYWTRNGFNEYVKLAPDWVAPASGQLCLEAVGVDVADRKDRDWQLNYSNLVCQAVKHARKHGFTDFVTTLRDMMMNTRWKPVVQITRGGGIPDFYFKDFEYRMGQRKVFDMEWIKPRF